MKIIQHTCDFCGFYYEERAPAGYTLAEGMAVVANRHICLDCQTKTEKLLVELLENEKKSKNDII
jgi:rubredoxin